MARAGRAGRTLSPARPQRPRTARAPLPEGVASRVRRRVEIAVPRASALEPTGIEPVTSCLQSSGSYPS